MERPSCAVSLSLVMSLSLVTLLLVLVRCSTALHNLLEALRKPPGTKLFSFGLQALNLLVQLSPSWPPFCEQVSAGLVGRAEGST